MVKTVSNACTGIAEDLQCDRRMMLAGAGFGLLLMASPAGAAVAGRTEAGKPARVAFFGDRPIMDRSGKLPAYQGPSGFRGAGGLASEDEAKRRFLSPFLT